MINDPDFRPRIDKKVELEKLSNIFRTSKTQIVNFFVDLGVEVLSRSVEEIKKKIDKEINKKFKVK